MSETGDVRWRRMQAQGLPSFLFWSGVVARGLPMAIVTMLLLQVFQGEAALESFGSTEFLQRLLLACLIFGAGGALSAFARWKSMEARFREGRD